MKIMAPCAHIHGNAQKMMETWMKFRYVRFLK